jgi:transmembrane sensor
MYFMTQQEVILLAEKISSGIASDSEIMLYNQLLDSFQSADAEWNEELLGNKEEIEQRIKTIVLKRIKVKRTIIQMKWFRLSAAAAIIVMIASAIFLLFFYHKPNQDMTKTNKSLMQDIEAPVVARATLKLDNGTIIYLDSARNGSLAIEGNIDILKTADGQLVYDGHNQTTNDLPPTFNTLVNPRGSKVVSLTLIDGTRVWLNSESSLRYPTAFAGSERKVEIIGEAYFEVTHNDKMPFRVMANGVEVEDLGTEFNVSAYADEAVVKTTLVNGAVKIQSAVLKPGQQAQVNSSKEIKVISAELNEVIAWKEGWFHFESADLKTILREFSRWYDIEIVYEGQISNEKYFSIISRQTTLMDVLRSLQANDIKFRVEGKKLFVLGG